MMYVDTCVLVAALTKEPGTPRMQAWFGAQPEGELVISEWVSTEFSAALSIKVRTGQIYAADRSTAIAALDLRSYSMPPAEAPLLPPPVELLEA